MTTKVTKSSEEPKRGRGRPRKPEHLKARCRKISYKADISHCIGNDSDICDSCVHRAMFRMWLQLDNSKREGVILLPQRARRQSCRNHMAVQEYFDLIDEERKKLKDYEKQTL